MKIWFNHWTQQDESDILIAETAFSPGPQRVGNLGGIIGNLLPLGQSHWAPGQVSNDPMPGCLTAVWWPL